MSSAVVDTWSGLDAPSAERGDRTFTTSVVGGTGVRVAKSVSGHAALLVPGVASTRAPVHTRHVRVDFGAKCVLAGEPDQTLIATVIECTSDDDAVRRQFLVTTAAVVDALGPTHDDAGLANALETLIELFQAMANPPKTSIQGLWGELLIMVSAHDPALLAESWHVTAADHHDFAREQQRVEVKTAGGRHRRHRFSLDQLDVPEGTELLVVSVQLETSAAGSTVRDLTTQLCDRLGREARMGILAGVADALGANWELADRHRYDVGAAARSIRYYDHRDVPRPADVPDGVTDVRFTADLRGAHPRPVAEVRKGGGLFAALVDEV